MAKQAADGDPAAAPSRKKSPGAQAPSRDLPRTLPGVAPALVSRLAGIGLVRGFDFVLHLPLRYEDETRVTAIADLLPGVPAQVEGVVQDTKVTFRPRRQLVCRITDASGELFLRFMNFYPSHQATLTEGTRIRAFGELRAATMRGMPAEMIHPRFRALRGDVDAPAPLPEALTPVYPTTAGVSQAALRRAIEAALVRESLEDTLPPALVQKTGLPAFRDAVLALHHPAPDGDAHELEHRSHPAWRRMKFDELLAQQLSLRLHYRSRRARNAPVLVAPPEAAVREGSLTNRLLAALPFRLTGAQARAWGEIAADLAQPHPMHRLLQGDVGSGKTVVAALAALRAIEHGMQAVVMAPTEILAEQHHRKFREWLEPLGIRIAWLSGSLPKKERDGARAAIGSGEAQLSVGTHALFQEGVDFPKLALAIVDEQHRFGVAQRLALRNKGGADEAGSVHQGSQSAPQPHQLMMSATPIPRTLSMSFYADLDCSTIDELPPGRKPVLTKLVSAARRDEVTERVRAACAAGAQAYWVCPLIEESEAVQLQTALDTYEALVAELPELRVGLVHGRLKRDEKAQVMQAFVAGEVQVLVATTVIEVGVDVPNASLMVIEHAERFGLAQLHQLRGRVGRGERESVCVLLYQGPLGEGARRRLQGIYESQDGFAIARADLELRGPGEFLGARQSGLPLLRFADLQLDADLLEEARDAAEQLLASDPGAARRHLERWLGSKAGFLQA